MSKVSYSVAVASVIGSEHQRLLRNRQDAVSVGQIATKHMGEFIFGAICDGCTEGFHSEVGAHMTADFLVHEMRRQLQLNGLFPGLPDLVFRHTLMYLKDHLDAVLGPKSDPCELAEYVKENLLSTIIAFVMTEKRTVILSAGDGVYVLNGRPERIEQDNLPSYPAYNLVPRKYISKDASIIPAHFHCIQTVSQIDQLIIASDGLEDDMIPDICASAESSLKLRRRIQVMLMKERRPIDDCTVIAVTREEEVQGGEAPSGENECDDK